MPVQNDSRINNDSRGRDCRCRRNAGCRAVLAGAGAWWWNLGVAIGWSCHQSQHRSESVGAATRVDGGGGSFECSGWWYVVGRGMEVRFGILFCIPWKTRVQKCTEVFFFLFVYSFISWASVHAVRPGAAIGRCGQDLFTSHQYGVQRARAVTSSLQVVDVADEAQPQEAHASMQSSAAKICAGGMRK